MRFVFLTLFPSFPGKVTSSRNTRSVVLHSSSYHIARTPTGSRLPSVTVFEVACTSSLSSELRSRGAGPGLEADEARRAWQKPVEHRREARVSESPTTPRAKRVGRLPRFGYPHRSADTLGKFANLNTQFIGPTHAKFYCRIRKFSERKVYSKANVMNLKAVDSTVMIASVCVSLFYVNDIGSTGSRGRTWGFPVYTFALTLTLAMPFYL
jgi:hypothetical protein